MEKTGRQQLVVLDDVTRTFGQGNSAVRALDRVSLSVAQEEFVVVMGPSGSGKTSLLHIMAGLDRPTGGEVYFAGAKLSLMDERCLARLRRCQIGIVFQFFNLLPTLTAEENVALPLMLEGLSGRQCRERASAALAVVQLSQRASHKPAELSGGEMQRVAIARALVIQPRLMLADEPTGNLDSQASRQVMTLLGSLNRLHGCAVVMVTHNASLASSADRVLLLQDGRIVEKSARADSPDEGAARPFGRAEAALACAGRSENAGRSCVVQRFDGAADTERVEY